MALRKNYTALQTFQAIRSGELTAAEVVAGLVIPEPQFLRDKGIYKSTVALDDQMFRLANPGSTGSPLEHLEDALNETLVRYGFKKLIPYDTTSDQLKAHPEPAFFISVQNHVVHNRTKPTGQPEMPHSSIFITMNKAAADLIPTMQTDLGDKIRLCRAHNQAAAPSI